MPFVSSVRGNYAAGKRKAYDISSKLLISGGTITTAGGYRIHTFTTAGNSTFSASIRGLPLAVEYLIVGGGGGGGSCVAGGGGAGGLLSGSATLGVADRTVTVGDRGERGGPDRANNTQTNGGSSIFNSVTAYGGGRGSSYDNATTRADTAGTVGSGGGGTSGTAGSSVAAAGPSTAGQGYPGGLGQNNAGSASLGAGGGGA